MCYCFMFYTSTNNHTLYYADVLVCDFLRDLVEKLPAAHSFLLLGDAYMNVQEVRRRLGVYQCLCLSSNVTASEETDLCVWLCL